MSVVRRLRRSSLDVTEKNVVCLWVQEQLIPPGLSKGKSELLVICKSPLLQFYYYFDDVLHN